MATLPPSLESLGNDILYQLCKIVSRIDGNSKRSSSCLSQMNRTFRDFSVPYIFENIKLWDRDTPEGRLHNYCTQIIQLSQHLELHRHIKSLHCVLKSTGMKGCDSPDEVASSLVELLHRLNSLQFLNIELPQYCVYACVSAMRSSCLVFPSMRELALGNFCDFIVSMCPNVTIVRRSSEEFRGNIGDGLSLVKGALIAPRLCELQYRGSWHLEMIDALLKTPNCLQKLSIISPPRQISIQDIIGRLGQLDSLKSVTFANVEHLRIGFSPAELADPYDSDRDEAAEAIAEQTSGRTAEKNILVMVNAAFGKRSQLREIWFEDMSFYQKLDISGGYGNIVGNWYKRRSSRWQYIPAPWY